MTLIARCVFFIFLATSTHLACARESYIELLGVSLPNQMILENTKEKVILNGYAICSRWGKEIYVGALYTDAIEKRAEMLLLNDSPMAMVFFFVEDDISRSMLMDAFAEAIMINNVENDKNPIDKRLTELQEHLAETLNAGDTLAFQYSPQYGVTMLLNGKISYHWPYAKNFFNTLLRMWVGPYPISRNFKRAILNFPVS
ncbi:chalcone isomerase family protein [Candidatus Berkiella aquae]|uniref:Chalcone isomerase family protein n=1 Tax=Candidatus Berkiella aquae TaxID=295108 RepID=A0A0Q9YX90_9GAMM|nr:chalcone isomerase family protein [Candidatus Berkiella aquae]MCS5710903.1 chalcone isomerase family protein [Candidatus Berkiella aquae]